MPRIPATTPLRSARLRRIVAAYTINRTGTWFGFIALAVAVFDHTHSAIAVAALFLSGQVLPAVIVQPLVARVEASGRRGGLTVLYLFEALMTASLAALLAWHFQLVAIFVLVTLDGSAALAASALLWTAAARTAREWADAASERTHERDAHSTAELRAPSEAPAGVGEAGSNEPGTGEAAANETAAGATGADAARTNQVAIDQTRAREAGAGEAERRANAAMNVGFAVTFALGPPLAGVAVAAFGAPVTLVIDVVSFVVCGVMLTDVRSRVADGETASIRARVRAAWQYIAKTHLLRRLLIIETVALTFFEFSPPIEVAYAKVSLHAGDKGYGVLLGVWGLGVAIGSVVFARSLKRSLTLLLSAATLAVGLAYLGWALAPTLALACAAGLIGGIGNGVQWAALVSAVQRLTSEDMLGRVMGAAESMDAICAALGFMLGGTIAALGTPRSAFLVAGLGATLTTIAFVRLKLDASPAPPATPAAALASPGDFPAMPDRVPDATTAVSEAASEQLGASGRRAS
ncbi:MAG TPA: MFS transporter [Solirubrobacteraceae bacterium]|nr:MFS transporter [Solirubrobacteraceae bacterium]